MIIDIDSYIIGTVGCLIFVPLFCTIFGLNNKLLTVVITLNSFIPEDFLISNEKVIQIKE